MLKIGEPTYQFTLICPFGDKIPAHGDTAAFAMTFLFSFLNYVGTKKRKKALKNASLTLRSPNLQIKPEIRSKTIIQTALKY